MKVLTGGTPEKPLLADARKPITIQHLLTHTAGFTYHFVDSTVEKIFRPAKVFEASSLPDFVVDGECPMMFLPGASVLHRVHRFFRGMGGRYEA